MTGEAFIRIEEPDGTFRRGIWYPELADDGFHQQRWEVPLYNPYTDKIGDMEMYRGEVWIGRSSGKDGKIVVTSVPSILQTADDARQLAAALLAAADEKDRRDKNAL